jgi:SHS2 domain-containing protein
MGISVEKTFEIIDHTADTGIIAYGATMKQLFSNAASGMYSLIFDFPPGNKSVQRTVELQAPDDEALLVEWLNELLFLFDMEHVVFDSFEFDTLDKGKLEARCKGYKIDLQHNKPLWELKAATYHMLNIRKSRNGYQAQVIFDI